ncbi:tyrosine-type recombinase/integrase [Variovorax sp.]|uniref:tyrosine-type recombinase/integrase n=1 Tax=Variovorax sp. TaxID=1871043 RepID=UPI002D507869|nr:tyrosine-type recombinase/integrase [Variovorax sp.]HYP82183.1 tyrosine-type recombinase/integrase [Variovorax sp.]
MATSSAARAAGAPAPAPPDASWIERYLEYVRVERRLAPRTLELYATHLATLSERAGASNLALARVDVAHIRRWMAQMHGAGREPRGIALVLSCWRSFYRWLGQQGAVPANPVQDVHAPKAGRPLPKALSVDDAVQLADLRRDEADPWTEARDRAVVELLYGCGLRVGELVGLDLHAGKDARGWLDLDGAEAHVLGKGDKRRSVPIGRKAMEALRAWCALREICPAWPAALARDPAGAAALFIGQRGIRLTPQAVWGLLRRRSLQAGLSAPVHPHMLRHSFASHVLQSSGDLRAVQELLGHANIGTTQIYTRLDFQHLARAYDAAHPRAQLRGDDGARPTPAPSDSPASHPAAPVRAAKAKP